MAGTGNGDDATPSPAPKGGALCLDDMGAGVGPIELTPLRKDLDRARSAAELDDEQLDAQWDVTSWLESTVLRPLDGAPSSLE